tara:strand:+ start:124 stop:567 length:444 start_codon:yes stop_codon:yes gene_type:complete
MRTNQNHYLIKKTFKMNFNNLKKLTVFGAQETNTTTTKPKSTTKLTVLDLSQLDNLADEMNCSNQVVLKYLISLDSPRIDKGIVLAERTIKKLLIAGCEGDINTQKIRSISGCNFTTALKVLYAYREEVEISNGRPFFDSYFDKIKK